MALTENEKKELVALLKKTESREIVKEVWHELVKKMITVPVELCVLDDRNRVLLIYRKDNEFDGYHMPGSVVNDWETVEEAKQRLVQKEIVEDLGIEITEPEPIGWLDSPRDAGPAEPSTRHGLLLIHVARFHGDFQPREGVGFYDLDNLPKNTLGCHLFILPFIKRYLKDNKIILNR